MPTVVVRPRARIDLAEIWDYIAEDSEAQADAFVDRMTVKFRLLAQQPELGRTRTDLMAALRSFPFERYVIFYFPASKGIEVVRLLHSARDLEPQFHSGT
jgi:toxin ParE1/3/4